MKRIFIAAAAALMVSPVFNSVTVSGGERGGATDWKQFRACVRNRTDDGGRACADSIIDAARAAGGKYWSTLLAQEAVDSLYEVDSQSVDDEAFLVLSGRLLESGVLGYGDSLGLAECRRGAMLNMTGRKITDFTITLRDGGEARVSDCVKGSGFTVLMFYDPDCHLCAEAEKAMQRHLPVDVGVVMVCPFPEFADMWAAHATALPQEWTVGIAVDDIEGEGLYEFRYIPSIMLVDSEGRIVAKNIHHDTVVAEIEKAIADRRG